MKFESVKELEAIIKLCRKHGVDEVSMPSGLKLKLGDAPTRMMKLTSEVKETAEPLAAGVTEEEMLFWSSQQ